jgi:AcrR family transcriptional regulator
VAAPRTTRRDDSTPTRREQILVVAARLFARHGFHGVSIADLGAAVGVSGPALYRHFPGKEALLEEIRSGSASACWPAAGNGRAASRGPRSWRSWTSTSRSRSASPS